MITLRVLQIVGITWFILWLSIIRIYSKEKNIALYKIPIVGFGIFFRILFYNDFKNNKSYTIQLWLFRLLLLGIVAFAIIETMKF